MLQIKRKIFIRAGLISIYPSPCAWTRLHDGVERGRRPGRLIPTQPRKCPTIHYQPRPYSWAGCDLIPACSELNRPFPIRTRTSTIQSLTGQFWPPVLFSIAIWSSMEVELACDAGGSRVCVGVSCSWSIAFQSQYVTPAAASLWGPINAKRCNLPQCRRQKDFSFFSKVQVYSRL